MRAEYGVLVPSRRAAVQGAIPSYNIEKFLYECRVRDILDFISVINFILNSAADPGLEAEDWRHSVERIFREEGLPYTVDEAGVVHHYFDEELRRAVNMALLGLDAESWGAAKQAYEDGLAALDREPIDSLQALRRIFDACENVFKRMTGVSRLGSSEIEKNLKPIISKKFEGSNLNAAKLYCSSFGNWVNSLHQFRHADAEQAPSQPDERLTLALFSAGTGYLRWLVGIAEGGCE